MPTKISHISSINTISTESVLNGTEVEHFSTRLLRVSLAIEESRTYWQNFRDDLSKEERTILAFEQRWFGSKSIERVRHLLSEFSHRYDAYPIALKILRQWCPSNLVTRQNICHWHLQLVDPTYRKFTGTFLKERRDQKFNNIERDITVRWLTQEISTQWSIATTQRMATGLIATAADAGLCSQNSGTRILSYPQVTDEAITYWLYFLRHLSFKGSLLDNLYLASVGLSEGFLEQRLKKLPGITFSRMGDLYDFGWQYPDLVSFAQEVSTCK